MGILSFKCPDTEALFNGQRVPWMVNFQDVALRKLAMLNRAGVLADLRIPPGNRLESLKGDRAEQHSIRISGQWRICFTWTAAGPAHVEVVDYH